MVLVSFGINEKTVVGIFISDDTVAYGFDVNGDKIITRALVLWEEQIYSTPFDQLEVISEAR
jgi:hypothetical protein